MPISINDFQNTLDSSKIQGFVKLSGNGAVKSYGGGFFARHFGLYSKPSAEENNAVRRAFYESVMDTYNCRGELLAFLRQELGIDENEASTSGEQLSVRKAKDILQHVKAVVTEQAANVEERHSLLEDLAKRGFLVGAVRQHIVNSLALENQDVAETKLHNDEAAEIRHYAMDATTNRTVRHNLFEQLQKDGLCQGEIGTQVRAMLHLDDEEAVLEQLTINDRKAITDFARESSERVHAERIATHRLPSLEALEKSVSPDKLDFCKAVLSNPGASEQEICEVANHINSATIAKEHSNWANEVKGALAQLSTDIGADCSSLQEKLLQVLETQMQDRFATQGTTVDKEQIRGAFTNALNQMIIDRKTLVDGIATAPKFPADVAACLRKAAATLPEFCKPAQLQALLKSMEPLQAFLRLATADSVTEEQYLEAYDAMAASMNQGGAEYAANITEGLAAPKGSQFSKLLCEMGRLAVEAENGQPLAESGDKLKAMMARQIQQDKQVLGMVDKNEGDYRAGKAAISAMNKEIAQICEIAKHFGLEIELQEEKQETLTPEFDKHLERLDISRAIKNATDGKHFDITLRSAFKEAFLNSIKSSLVRADAADKYPDAAHAFTQGFLDYFRVGTGLKVGNTVITRVNEFTVDSERKARKQEMIGKLEQFFGEDQVNGQRALRIIGDIVHQGFMGSTLGSICGSREPFDIMLSEDSNHEMDFSVQRDQDGNYNIHYTAVFNYRSITEGPKAVWLDPSQSAVRYNINVTLSFDAQDGKPAFRFAQSPTMSGKLTMMGQNLEDSAKIRKASEVLGDDSLPKIIEISGVIHDITIHHLLFETENIDDAARLIRSRVITRSDMAQLKLLGFSENVVKQMILGSAGDEDTPRLGKEIIGRLLNPATREAAVNDLKAMAQPVVNAGWLEKVPDIHPEVINLISVAGLSTDSIIDGQSDAEMVCKFIAESQDPKVKSLPADLQSDNPQTVEAAKERVQELSRTLRRGLGLKLLSTHIRGVGDGQIALIEKHVKPALYRELLGYIADRDENFDQAIENFRSILEAVQIIQKEEAAMNKGN